MNVSMIEAKFLKVMDEPAMHPTQRMRLLSGNPIA